MMKIVSWFLCVKDLRPHFFSFVFLSPLLSARTQHKNKGQSGPLSLIILRLILNLVFAAFILFMGKILLRPMDNLKIVLICPVVYFLTDALGAFSQLLFSPFIQVSSMHRNPLNSKSLGDFWGRRWNIWVQDWLRDISRRHRKNLSKKIFLTFIASGLFHEVMVCVPYYICFQKNDFGNMTLYFIIQALGLLIEKKWLKNAPTFVKRAYLWIVIILPAPFFINKPLLTFFRIING